MPTLRGRSSALRSLCKANQNLRQQVPLRQRGRAARPQAGARPSSQAAGRGPDRQHPQPGRAAAGPSTDAPRRSLGAEVKPSAQPAGERGGLGWGRSPPLRGLGGTALRPHRRRLRWPIGGGPGRRGRTNQREAEAGDGGASPYQRGAGGTSTRTRL